MESEHDRDHDHYPTGEVDSFDGEPVACVGDEVTDAACHMRRERIDNEKLGRRHAQRARMQISQHSQVVGKRARQEHRSFFFVYTFKARAFNQTVSYPGESQNSPAAIPVSVAYTASPVKRCPIDTNMLFSKLYADRCGDNGRLSRLLRSSNSEPSFSSQYGFFSNRVLFETDDIRYLDAILRQYLLITLLTNQIPVYRQGPFTDGVTTRQ